MVIKNHSLIKSRVYLIKQTFKDKAKCVTLLFGQNNG